MARPNGERAHKVRASRTVPPQAGRSLITESWIASHWAEWYPHATSSSPQS